MLATCTDGLIGIRDRALLTFAFSSGGRRRSEVTAFQAGATPEDIAQKFPSVALPDVYLIIAHYLTHTAEIDAYLSQRQTEAARLQCAIETRFNPVGSRARLLARQRAAR
jgi:hypothetical protein